MKKHHLSVIILALTTFFPIMPGLAQEKDFQVWPSVDVKAEVYKNLKIQISEELRFRENSTLLSRQINDIGASYRFNKFVRAGIYYRLEADWKNADDYSWRRGIYGDISLRYNKSRFMMGYRFRMQSAKVESSDKTSFFDGFHHRHKFSLEYNVKGIPLTPFIESEFFFHSAETDPLKGLRTWLGADFTIREVHTISLKYGFDRELNTRNPLTAWIVAIGYSFDLSLIQQIE